MNNVFDHSVENQKKMCQGPVRRETTEGSSIEFNGYLISQYEQNDCTVLFTRHQSTKVCRAFSIF